jgi:predicted 3-demethylubiquinone-9 3-methyltransferase (glyoxalase superfamily)
MVRVTPCLMFDGNAAEAIAYYLKALPRAENLGCGG